MIVTQPVPEPTGVTEAAPGLTQFSAQPGAAAWWCSRLLCESISQTTADVG
jgi:hypothetical protein